MHCLLCKHGANEITECTPIDGVIVCADCAHDETLFCKCEDCGGQHKSEDMIEADNGDVFCNSCVPYRWSENDAPTTGDEGWAHYRDALSKENLSITGCDLSNALSTALGV